ncbi:MAG TPA: S8 family serine peptidase, partial [Egibacteraceae bacterium]
MGTTVAARTVGEGEGRRLAGVMVVLALLAALLAPATADASSWGRYLVDAAAQLPAGTRVLERLPVADALLVTAPTAPAGAVDADTALGFESLAELPDADGLRVDSAVASTGAAEVWPTTTGEQAVVALVDTGVAPVPAMEGAVAGEIDFTGSGGGDGYGHGTFMASLIAGRGAVARGVAPGTGILSLKVADDRGATTLGTVLSALDWLYGPGRVTGVRIVSLALGVDAGSPAARFLDNAVDRLSRVGVLVVTAAGNDGEGTLGAPATAAGSLSVGAVDDRGTADRADDVPADFSATGVDRRGVAQPDLVASGVSVVGALPPDSVIARE